MFGDRAIKSFSVTFIDYAADEDVGVFVAPDYITIKSAYVSVPNAIAAGTANLFDVALYNGGTAGTALTVVAGTIGGSVGWDSLTPVAFTISNGVLRAGELLKVRYDETGTATIAGATLTVNYVNGQGAAI